MRAALARLQRNEPETYRAQDYSLNYFRALNQRIDAFSAINLAAGPFDETVDGIRVIGLRYLSPGGSSAFADALDMLQPTHLLVRAPFVPILKQGLDRNLSVLPLLADSFPRPTHPLKAARNWIREKKLAHVLNDPRISFVANHNIPACQDLAKIGVRPDKIVPWDWPSDRVPDDYAPKALPESKPFRLLYVGAISEAKGVADLIKAFEASPWLQAHATLDIVGNGEVDVMRAMIQSEASQNRITFVGPLPNPAVLERMHKASLVIVPSRACYPEGLPGTIYEALTVRTPLLLSDHPMFVRFLEANAGVRFFEGGNPESLAINAQRLLTSAADYRSLSEKTAAAFDSIHCPNLWHDVIENWLQGDRHGYLADRAGAWQRANARNE